MNNVVNFAELKPSKEYESIEDVTAKRKEESHKALRHIKEWDLFRERSVQKATYYVVEDLYDTYVEHNLFTEADEYEAEQHLIMLKDFLMYEATCRANHSEYRSQ